ncbi:MAG: homocysteine S-methyltransferase family protein, partial [Saccharofermentanales bacterium]
MNRSKELVEIIGKRFLISDGGFGSMLQKHGIKTGDAGLNINNPEAVIRIHEAYLNCGSQIVTTNTFGIDRIHLEGSEYSVKQVIAASITNAKQ